MKRWLSLILVISLQWTLPGEDYYLIVNTESGPDAESFYLGHYFTGFGPGKSVRDSHELEFDEDYEPPVLEDPDEIAPEIRYFYYEEWGEIRRLQAQLVYNDPQGSCLIYVQRSGAVQERDWDALGAWFDGEVYPSVSQNFGIPGDVDKNGRVILLFYKFGSQHLSGYFNDTDLFSSSRYSGSNQAEILYFNLRYRRMFSSLMKETYPHELQHLINASLRMSRSLEPMELWLNEGLAESAAHLALGSPWEYNQEIWNDPDGEFWAGTSLTRWKGDLRDYALSYLFVQYIRAQTGDKSFLRQLISMEDPGLMGVIDTLDRYEVHYDSPEDLLQSFYLAILLQKEEGIWGFGDIGPELNLQVRSPKPSFNGILVPGAAVYLPLSTGEPRNPLPETLKVLDTRDYR